MGRLGDILSRAKLITQAELSIALEHQRNLGGRLGEILVSLGFVTEFDMYSTLALQLGHPFMPNPEAYIDPAVTRLVSEDLAMMHRVVPLCLQGDALLVAAEDPLNLVALDDIALMSGRRVGVAVAPGKAVEQAFAKAYGLRAPVAFEPAPATAAYDLGQEGDGGAVRLVNNLVIQALNQRATDIHIEPADDKVRVRYRIDGVMQGSAPLPKALLQPVLSRIKVMAGLDIAERRLPQDGRIEAEIHGRRVDLRVATVPTIHGEKAAIRLLDRSMALLGLADLGMEPDVLEGFRALLGRPNGMVLVTGPTGSGKTTTLMAALAELNHPSRHILTIEDPVEYHVPGINQVQVNPRAGLTFAAGLRSFLRQDPDVIMLGEIRDSETADIAVRAALTGHTLLSTLHTSQAAGAPGRLADMGVEPFLLASSLSGVLAQRLVRALCPRCREPYCADERDPDFALLVAAGLPGQALCRPGGCGHCEGLGYRGRVVLTELLPVTGELRELIVRRASTAEMERAARAAGMRPLWQDGLRKVAEGLTTLAEVKRVAFAEV